MKLREATAEFMMVRNVIAGEIPEFLRSSKDGERIMQSLLEELN